MVHGDGYGSSWDDNYEIQDDVTAAGEVYYSHTAGSTDVSVCGSAGAVTLTVSTTSANYGNDQVDYWDDPDPVPDDDGRYIRRRTVHGVSKQDVGRVAAELALQGILYVLRDCVGEVEGFELLEMIYAAIKLMFLLGRFAVFKEFRNVKGGWSVLKEMFSLGKEHLLELV